MQRPLPFLLIPLAILCGRLVLAQPGRPADAADEETLLRRGLELRQAQQDEAALREFQRAWELSRSGRALAQIALAEQALGRWLDAEEHLTSALKRNTEEWIGRNRALLEQALHDIEGHLGWVELTGELPAGWVSINGKRAATLPTPEPVRAPAGSIAVEARADGYLPILRMVVVPARGLAREPLVFVPAAQSAPTPPVPVVGEKPPTPVLAPVRPGWRTQDTAGVVVGAFALGALATGITFHVIREDRADNYQRLGCEAPTAGNFQDCRSRYDGVRSATYVAIAGYAGAAALSAVAAYLLFGRGESTSKPVERWSASCGVGLGPGLVCGGRF